MRPEEPSTTTPRIVCGDREERESSRHVEEGSATRRINNYSCGFGVAVSRRTRLSSRSFNNDVEGDLSAPSLPSFNPLSRGDFLKNRSVFSLTPLNTHCCLQKGGEEDAILDRVFFFLLRKRISYLSRTVYTTNGN